ncbi:hypothetical protein ACH492_24480 [Streptomyces sp. NPDC019443]|uniref:hypothetical protein n=1 Tax=Streptomyces sp. NPDC019443 TaxID=3365061 RepID=UPI0037A7EAFF
MRNMLSRLMVPAAVVVMAVTTGCSSDSGGGDRGQGKPADEVCGAFAKDDAASAALNAISGGGNFTSSLSEPEKVIVALREAARTQSSAQERAQSRHFCWLLPAEGGETDLIIDFREVTGVPQRDARLEDSVTYFSTGGLASSSDSLASVFFKCRMKAPAHEIVIAAQLRGPAGNNASKKGIRGNQITVANAAARKVAADLGCQNDTKLVSGVPKPAA